MAILPFRPSAQKRFQRLVQPHLTALHSFAYRLTGSLQDAEDLVQDVVVKLYRAWMSWNPWISFGRG
ncbi:MAG: hypothetical protein LPK06_00120 [Marinobacter sp.]|nr:hypothetical protein [Marinobacter sp.]